jgi:hypothetical protein
VKSSVVPMVAAAALIALAGCSAQLAEAPPTADAARLQAKAAADEAKAQQALQAGVEAWSTACRW